MSGMSGTNVWIFGAVLMAVVVAPQISDACPVCFSARDENRLAFTLTTIFLTALPLAMIGSAVFWLRQRTLRLRQTRRDSAPRRQLALGSRRARAL